MTFGATVTDEAGNTSACSTGFTYVEDSTPTVSLNVATNPVLTGASVRVDASATGASIVRYEWDLDGNGSFETDTGTVPAATHSYSEAGALSIGVRVTNSAGKSAVARASLSVRLRPSDGEIGFTINNGDFATNSRSVVLSPVWPRYAETLLVDNDGGFRATAREFPVATTVDWTLASSGSERLPRTVYMKFRGGESINATFTDDIVLDQTRPSIDDATVVVGAETGPRALASFVSTALKPGTLKLRAKDNNSGVAQIQVRRGKSGKAFYSKRLTQRSRRGIRTLSKRLTLPLTSGDLYTRVLDAAGNASPWKKVKRGSR
jgi:hypothetical protein